MVHISCDGYRLDVVFKKNYVYLCGVNMGQFELIGYERVESHVLFELAEQGTKRGLEYFGDDVLKFFVDSVMEEIEGRKPAHQVTDDVPFFG